jgi:hypothetical protein
MMAEEPARRKQITIEEATSTRLQDETTQAIRRISITEESIDRKGFSCSLSKGVLGVHLELKIPIASTLKKAGAILATFLTLAEIFRWLTGYVK